MRELSPNIFLHRLISVESILRMRLRYVRFSSLLALLGVHPVCKACSELIREVEFSMCVDASVGRQ